MMPKTALLLMDLQNAFLHPKGTLAGDSPTTAQGMLDTVRQLVAWAHEHRIPVIWAGLAYRPGRIDAARRVKSWDRASQVLVEGSWQAEFLGGLGRRDDDILVRRKRPSAFFQTDLNLVLHGLGVERLIVGGVSTNWAVESSVRDGQSYDYEMIVVREATGTPFTELHEPSLLSMGTIFAEVVTLAEVMETTGAE